MLPTLACVLLASGVTAAGAAGVQIGPDAAFAVYAVYVAPERPEAIYASGSLGSQQGDDVAWRTEDGGKTWRRIDFGVPGTGVLAIDPYAPRTLYAVVGGQCHRSDDAGSNWTALGRLPIEYAHSPPGAIVMDPERTGTLYVGVGDQTSRGDGAVLKSDDGGVSWSMTELRGATIYDLVVSIDLLYASGKDGLFESSDGGATWKEIGPHGVPSRLMSVAVDPTDPARIFVATSGSGVFRSLDGGGSWKAVNEGLTHPTIYEVTIDPARPGVVWAGTSGDDVYVSLDGGESWSAVGLPTRYTASIVIVPGRPSTVFAAAARRGLFRISSKP